MFMPRATHLFCVLFSALLSIPASAAPGDLDASFGSGKGWVSTGFAGLGNGEGRDILRQADGKLVVAGIGWNSSNADFALVRYNSDGTLDATFNGTGKVATSIGTGDDQALSVIQQADGKLVAAGYSYDSDGNRDDFALVRYNSDGSLDTTFNGTGKVTTTTDMNTDSRAYSVIQQADGKLVATGYGKSGLYNKIMLVRYNSDGTLDTTFDADGKVTTGIHTNDSASSIIQQADGKLVVAGYSSISSGSFALVRYNDDGSLDTTFGGSGIVTTKPCGGYSDPNSAGSLIQQTDGKLVAAGSCNSGSTLFALARYNANGSLDTTFNGTGKIANVAGIGRSVIQQSDGKLVVTGYVKNVNNDDFALLRYSANGTLDTTFNGTGKIIVDTGSDFDQGFSVIQQVNGKLVVAGTNGEGSLVLLRHDTYGSLDASFDDDGIILDSMLSYSQDIGQSVIQQADGKLVVAGYAKNGSDDDFALARYDSNGVLDPAFNGTGKVTMDIGGGPDRGASVIQQVDGKLVVAGLGIVAGNAAFALVRYNNDGSVDATFNGTGKLTTDFGGGFDGGYSMIEQVDGKLVVAGFSYSNSTSSYDFALARYSSNGVLDTTFNGTGMVTTDISGSQDQGVSVVQQADGKLVVAGSSWNGSNNYIALVRYNSNGSLDTTFNGTGKVTTGFGYSDSAMSVIQQVDGKLVVAGNSYDVDSGRYGFALVRYNSNGSLDTTFNGTGKTTTEIGAYRDIGLSVIQQTDGKLVVAVNSAEYNGYDGALVRYNSDGSLDTTFGNDGKSTVAIGTGDDYVVSVIQQMDGKLVTVGYSENMPTGQEFVVARFESGLDAEDIDGDGILNGNDAFPRDPAESVDTDGDGIGDNRDAFPGDPAESVDTDNDGVGDNGDNCSLVANTDQVDLDGDGMGNACDPDIDGDGIADTGTGQISAGGGHTCALDANGVHCWGVDDDRTVVPPLVNPVVVSAGELHTCALDDNGVHCWGNGLTDADVPQLVNPVTVSAGASHTCAVDANGVQCWGGWNEYGQTDVPPLVNPVAVSAGGYHTCALDANGVHCWGWNEDGQTDVPPLVNPVAVSTGGYHTCALDADGVHCWGWNEDGQTNVPPLVNPVAVSAGGYHTCALDANGVHCWGWNEDGQTDVPPLLNPRAVSAGWYHTCALVDDGVQCWSWGDEGMPDALVPPAGDNCLFTANPDQLDTDADGAGNACDSDDDNDGVPDASDAFPLNPAEWLDTDGDGIGNNADYDDDNDGVPDVVDAAPLDAGNTGELVLPLDGGFKGASIREGVSAQ